MSDQDKLRELLDNMKHYDINSYKIYGELGTRGEKIKFLKSWKSKNIGVTGIKSKSATLENKFDVIDINDVRNDIIKKMKKNEVTRKLTAAFKNGFQKTAFTISINGTIAIPIFKVFYMVLYYYSIAKDDGKIRNTNEIDESSIPDSVALTRKKLYYINLV